MTLRRDAPLALLLGIALALPWMLSIWPFRLGATGSPVVGSVAPFFLSAPVVVDVAVKRHLAGRPPLLGALALAALMVSYAAIAIRTGEFVLFGILAGFTAVLLAVHGAVEKIWGSHDARGSRGEPDAG